MDIKGWLNIFIINIMLLGYIKMDAAAQLIIHDTFPFLDFWSRRDQT